MNLSLPDMIKRFAINFKIIYNVDRADFVKKDTWMHIAATWDFGGDAFFYINGEEIATAKGLLGFPNFVGLRELAGTTSLSTESPHRELTVLLMNSPFTAKRYRKRTSKGIWSSLFPKAIEFHHRINTMLRDESVCSSAIYRTF